MIFVLPPYNLDFLRFALAGQGHEHHILRAHVPGMRVLRHDGHPLFRRDHHPANYQIIVDRVRNTDTFDVQVEMTPEMFTDNMGEIKNRQAALEAGMRAMLGISARVVLVAPKTIARSEGKAVRVIDKRKI